MVGRHLSGIQAAWVVVLIPSVTQKIPFPFLDLSFPSVNKGVGLSSLGIKVNGGRCWGEGRIGEGSFYTA